LGGTQGRGSVIHVLHLAAVAEVALVSVSVLVAEALDA